MRKISSGFTPSMGGCAKDSGAVSEEAARLLAGNPQDINAFMDRMGLSGAGAFGAPAAPGGGAPPVADPEAAYASQLEQLQVCTSQTLPELGGGVSADAWRAIVVGFTGSFVHATPHSIMEVGLLNDSEASSCSAAEPFSVRVAQGIVACNAFLCAQGMGFYDRQANIVALQATGGNVSAAVDRLLQGPQ